MINGKDDVTNLDKHRKIPSNKCSAHDVLQNDNSEGPPDLSDDRGDSVICKPFGILIPKGIRLMRDEPLGIRTVNCVCTLFISNNITLMIVGIGMSCKHTDICKIAHFTSSGVLSDERRARQFSSLKEFASPIAKKQKNNKNIITNYKDLETKGDCNYERQ